MECVYLKTVERALSEVFIFLCELIFYKTRHIIQQIV